MPTEAKKTIAGLLLVGASMLTSNVILSTIATGIGVNWTSEGLAGLWGQAGTLGDQGTPLARAGERAIRRAVERLRHNYQREYGRTADTQAFDLVRDCADVLLDPAIDLRAATPLTAQQALAPALGELLHGHEPHQVERLQRQLLPAVVEAFRDELAANPEAWARYHGWLIERLTAQIAALTMQLSDIPSGINELQRDIADIRAALEQQSAGPVHVGGTAFSNLEVTTHVLDSTKAIVHEQIAIAAAQTIRDPVGDFVGRENEMVEVLDNTFNVIKNICHIYGMPGVGKTEFMYALVNKISPRFERKILISIKEDNALNLTAKEILKMIVYKLGCSIVSDDVNELQEEYIRLLGNTKTLVIIDNVIERSQVEELVPPKGSGLLITSRSRFVLPGSYLIETKVFSFNESINFVLGICPRIDEFAPKLVRLCGCLPLALRISASLLHSDITIDVSDYINKLNQERNRLVLLDDSEENDDKVRHSVEASFNISYRSLSPEYQSSLIQMGIFADPFSVKHAKDVIMISDGYIDYLGKLVKMSLLRYDEKTKLYSLHDLLKCFALSKLNGGLYDSVLNRFAWSYLKFVLNINEIFKIQKESPFIWFISNNNNINMVLGYFLKERDAENACKMIKILGYFWRSCNYEERGINWISQFIKLDIPDKILEADMYVLRGSLARVQKEKERVYEDYRNAIEIYKTNHDTNSDSTKVFVDIVLDLADAYCDFHEYDLAESLLLQGRDMAEQITYNMGVARSLQNLARILTIRGKYELSVALCRKAISLYPEDDQSDSFAWCNSALAHNLDDSNGNLYEAKEYAERAWNIFRTRNHMRGMSWCGFRLVSILLQLGELDQAIYVSNIALDIFNEANEKNGIGLVNHKLGRIYIQKGSIEKARECFLKSIDAIYQVYKADNKILALVALSLEDIAIYCYHIGLFKSIVVLISKSYSLRSEIKVPLPKKDIELFEILLRKSENDLGDNYHLIWDNSRNQSVDNVVRLGRSILQS